MKFENYNSRATGKSIYTLDNACPIDPLYDALKIKKGIVQTTRGTGKSSFVDLKKQTTRNARALYSSSVGEAFANIERQNKQ
jgi:hypothetical protein